MTDAGTINVCKDDPQSRQSHAEGAASKNFICLR
jgi:hypothetical protein